MKPVTILFLCFLLIPLGEIYLLIQIGEVIGAGWTILGVVTTAVIGAFMVKIQGIITIDRAVRAVRNNEIPAVELIEGLFLLLAGALLITPGFVTDAIGFLCLTPPLRRHLAGIAVGKIVIHIRSKHPTENNETIDVEYREIK